MSNLINGSWINCFVYEFLVLALYLYFNYFIVWSLVLEWCHCKKIFFNHTSCDCLTKYCFGRMKENTYLYNGNASIPMNKQKQAFLNKFIFLFLVNIQVYFEPNTHHTYGQWMCIFFINKWPQNKQYHMCCKIYFVFVKPRKVQSEIITMFVILSAIFTIFIT